MRRALSRGSVLGLGVVVAVLLLIAGTQVWLTLELKTGSTAEVAGSTASPALLALSLALLAVFVASSIAGRAMLRVLGALVLCLGVCILVGVIGVVVAPLAVAASSVGELTGVAGPASIAAQVQSFGQTPWPMLTGILAVLASALGLVIMVLARGWSLTSRHRSLFTVRAEESARLGVDPEDSAATWDSLSTGADPTESGTAAGSDATTRSPTNE